jgi:CubicO group peptidase (beta-lactamase class C family)
MANHMTKDAVRQMCENACTLHMRPDRLLLLDSRLEEWSHNGITPSIAVRVLRHGQLAFEGAYGVLGPDKEPGSLTTDAIFPVCSITKPTVATMLFIMQEEGLIDVNQAVRNYLPEFTGDPKGLVKVWHLLSHTSGIDEDFHKKVDEYIQNTLGLAIPGDDAPYGQWEELAVKVREKLGLPDMEPSRAMTDNTFLLLSLSIPPAHKPHEVMSYSSFGYQIAIEIIKRVSGRSVEEFFTEKLFAPLHMKDSHFHLPKDKLHRFVTRPKDFDGSGWLNEEVLESESGGGGLKTTVSDMTSFGQMFLNEGKFDGARLLSKASVREMTTDHNSGLSPAYWHGEHFGANWGLGWDIRCDKNDDSGILRSARSFDHCGYCCCNITCDPAADVVLAYFTVCKTDSYTNSSHFHNMVIGSIDD